MFCSFHVGPSFVAVRFDVLLVNQGLSVNRFCLGKVGRVNFDGNFRNDWKLAVTIKNHSRAIPPS
jgi:hypothetical protein